MRVWEIHCNNWLHSLQTLWRSCAWQHWQMTLAKRCPKSPWWSSLSPPRKTRRQHLTIRSMRPIVSDVKNAQNRFFRSVLRPPKFKASNPFSVNKVSGLLFFYWKENKNILAFLIHRMTNKSSLSPSFLWLLPNSSAPGSTTWWAQ